MSLKVFLELVEIKAKTASVLPFLLGVCFSYYYYHSLNWANLLLFFIAMFLFNMSVDAWDNYNDYHNALDKEEYKQKTNIIGRENLSPREVLWLLLGMAGVATVLGVVLVLRTGWPLLLMGMFCFAVGILYSAGPRPLSSLPVGEFFSGFTMGGMIMLISIYINTYQEFSFDLSDLWRIALLALPNMLWISNLMLANNICDLAEDERNHRYTIVHYLGKKQALQVYTAKNILALVSLCLTPFIGLAPYTVLLIVLALPFFYRQNKLLWEKQVKTETFITAVKTLAVGSFLQVILYLLGILFNLIF